MASLAVVAVPLIASLFMAWTVGANSNSAPFAPAVGANALPVLRAALFVGIFASLGAVLQGANISGTIGNQLVLGTSITSLAAGVGLLTAAAFITVGNRRGYPMPAAFTVTGSIIGVGLALGGIPATSKYVEIAVFWVLIPVFGAGIGFVTAKLLRNEQVPETVAVPLLGGVVGFVIANMSVTFIPSETGRQGTLAGLASSELGVSVLDLGEYDAVMLGTSLVLAIGFFVGTRYWVKESVKGGVRKFLVILGALVVFSSGGSQVGLATGPMESVFAGMGIPLTYLILLGGLAMLVGAWMNAPRVVQAVSREYSELGIRRSISALVPAFIITQSAITLGLPISMNEVIIASLIGSGLVEGSSGISASKTGYTVGIWLLSLGGAAVTAYLLYGALSLALGVS